MDEHLLKELQVLKETIKVVQQRIDALERRAAGMIPASAPRPVPAAVPIPKPVVSEPVKWEPPKPAAPVPAETLETRIGRDWLNKIGITSLVLGVVFFILYTFQYLGPALKIAMGYAVAGGLIGLGVWVERRDQLRWYARGLIGGGWALLYFVTYAMHHLPAVRLVESAGLDLALLAIVAAGAVRHSLKYQSERITALALSLGFITTSISGITTFTLASSALLVGALAWIVTRMRWHGLYLYGVVASYLTYGFWISPQIDGFWFKMGFVGLYWTAYNAVLFAMEEKGTDQRNMLLTATLTNGLAFVWIALAGMDPIYQEARYLFLLAVGAAYALSEPLARGRGLPAVAETHLLLGLSLMTLAIPLKLSGRWVSFLWAAEVPLFVWLGLRYARWSYRLFAVGLAAVLFGRVLCLDFTTSSEISLLGRFVPWRVVIGCMAIGSFGLAAAGYRLPRHRQALKPEESQAFRLYLFAAALLLWFLLALEVHWRWVPAAWMAEAAGTVLLGFLLRDRAVRLLGAVGCGVTAFLMGSWMLLRLQGLETDWNPWVAAWVIAFLFGLSFLYRSREAGDSFESEGRFKDFYAAAATALLTALLGIEISRQWLSVAWALEGLALVTAGFALKDKLFRVAGLCVFGLLVLKILFVDLSGAETIYRILSFIVAGVILLLASFAYARKRP